MRLRPLVFTAWLLPLALVATIPGLAETPNQSGLEKRLTTRVNQIYQLFVSGEWEKVTPFISKDTLNIWLAQNKSIIEGFKIDSIQIAPDGKQAEVTVMATFHVPQVPTAPFSMAQKTQWVYEKGQWFMKVRPRPSQLELFQMMAQSSAAHMAPSSPLVFDQNPVKIPRSGAGTESVATVSFQNIFPMDVSIQDLKTNCACLKAEVDRTALPSTTKGVLTIKYSGPPDGLAGATLAVQATIAPMMYSLKLPVVLGDNK